MKNNTQEPSKKNLLTLGLPATIVAGLAVGAVFGPASIAAAAEDGDASEASTEDKQARKEARQERKAEYKASVADILGISVDVLETAKEDGQTLAEIGEDNDVDRADLVAALIANANERIDAAVEEGNLDEEKAAELRENLEERVENRVDGVRGEKGEGKRPGGKGHGYRS